MIKVLINIFNKIFIFPKGTLSFYKNGEFLGIAFEEEELKTGEFFPACAPIYN